MKRLLSSAFLVAALLPLSAFAAPYTFSIPVPANGSTNNNPFTTIANGATPANGNGLSHGQAVTWGLGSTNDGTNYTGLFNDINGGGKVVTSATLTITGIFDWTTEGNDSADALYVHILAGLDVPTAAGSNVGVAGLSSKYFDNASPTTNLLWSNDVDPFVDDTTATSFNNRLQTTTQAGYTGTPLAFQDATAGSLLKSTDADQATAGGTPTTITWTDKSGTVASTVVITFNAANLSVLTALLDADSTTGTPNVGLGFAAECHYYMTGVTLSVTTGPHVPDSGSTLALMGLGLVALAGFRRSKK